VAITESMESGRGLAIAEDAGGLREPLRRPFGRAAVDALTERVGNPLHRISPVFGNAYNDGARIRVIFGNAYFVWLAAAAVLGGWAVQNTHGIAVPPVLWLTLLLMVVGIFDAFAGLIASIVFALGVIFSGHFFSSHLVTGPPGTQGMLYAFTGLLSMAFLWFIGPQLPRRLRLLGFNAIKDRFQRRYIIIGDFFVVTILAILILGSLPVFLPSFTGANKQDLTQVVLQNHLTTIKIVVAIAMILRVAYETMVHAKFKALPLSTGRVRSNAGRWFIRISGALIALALIWEILGTVWQWPVTWLIFVSLDVFSAVGERFLRPSSVFRFVPRNLFRIVTLLLFEQYMSRVLNGQYVSGEALLGWLALTLAIVIAMYAFLDGVDDEESGDTRATWWTRLLGIIVVILLFIISQGLVSVATTPYANPTDVAISANGVLYIADSGNNRIIEVTPAGGRTTVGSGYSNPGGVAPDPSSSSFIYVADTNNNRVLKVETTPVEALALSNGTSHVANAGAATTQTAVGSGFKHPTGLATDSTGRLFVADTGNNRIVEILPNGDEKVFVTGLSSPLAISTDPFGHLFVANTGAGSVLEFTITKDGHATNERTFATGLQSPSGVAADANQNVYVANTGKDEVLQYTPDHQRHVMAGDFHSPRGLGVDGAGHLYVADAGSGGVVLAAPLYASTSSTIGPHSPATAVSLVSDGSSYVVTSNNTLEHVTPQGTTILVNNLDQSHGVAVSALGRIYVSQSGNGTIDQVLPDGSLKILATGLTGVTSITPDPYGGLFALEPVTGDIVAVDAQGRTRVLVQHLKDPVAITQDAYDNLDVTLAGTKSHGGEVVRVVFGGKTETLATGLSDPTSITADGNGDVFFVEHGTRRVWEIRGLLGTQIVFEGTSAKTDPVAIAADRNGNVVVMPAAAGATVRLNSSNTQTTI